MKRRSIVVSLVVMFVLAGAVALLAGCGTDATQKAQTAYDNDVENLKTAVTGMQDPSTYESVDSLQAAFSEVQGAYNAVVASAKEVTGAKITNLQDAYNRLKAAIANVTSDQTLGEKVDAIQAAVQDLSDAIQQL